MKRGSTVILQVVVVLVGLGALAFLLWEPHVEGRNQDATVMEVYFTDPFLAYVYFSSIPFFVGLYQGFKVLGYAGQDKMFSPAAVKSLRTIKYCAITIIALVVVSAIFMLAGDPEDRPPGVMMRVAVILASIVVASAAAVGERVLRNAVELKSENDLTV